MIGIAFFSIGGQVAVVTAAGYETFDNFQDAADHAARLSPAISFPYPPLPDESPPEPRRAPTASARVSLACGHVQEFKEYHYLLLPHVGDRLWCYQCEPGDERAVTQVEIL